MKYILSLIVFLASLSLNAQRWDSNTTREFQNAEDIAITIYIEDAKIWELSKDKFYLYYSEKYNKSKDYLDILFERFTSYMRKDICEKFGRHAVSTQDAKFELIYYIQEITQDAGIKGICFVKYGDKVTRWSIKFACEDGRWNDFENLLLENAKKIIYYPKDTTPFNFPFDKYEEVEDE